MNLDSVFRVVRVLVDGKPNTRISRTQFARSPSDVLVPHEKASGDTLTTRVRYHGVPRGGVRAGPNRYGARTLVAQASTVDPSLWLPVPESELRTAGVTFRIQSDSGDRAIANGKLDWSGHPRLRAHHLDLHHRSCDPAVRHRGCRRTLRRGNARPGRLRLAVRPSFRLDLVARFGVRRSEGPSAAPAEMVDYFTRLLGPFPWTSLAHVEAVIPTAAVSGASVILYGESGYGEQGLDETVVARETARQWLRPDAPDSAATYLAGLWAKNAAGKKTNPKDVDRIRGFLRAP